MEPQQTSSVYSAATSSELSKNDELDIEGIFFELSKQLEQEEKQDGVQESTLKETLRRQRFAKPTSKEDLAAVWKPSMPKRTQDDTAYCVKVWKEWWHCRVGKAAQENNPITSMRRPVMQELLSQFVIEMRKKDGSEYPPNTIYHICCGIMCYLRSNGHPGIDLCKDISFSDFRCTLDSEMKRLQGNGLGSKTRQAEPLTMEEEKMLWESRQLGDHCPQALVDTMLYMCGTYFALRSGQEHRALRFVPSQIELAKTDGERAFLRYTEDV